MARWLHLYRVLLVAYWRVLTAYRAEMLLWIVAALGLPLVNLAVWWSLAAAGPIAGYTQAGFLRYYLAVILVERLTRSWVPFQLIDEIRTGKLAQKLVRPLHPVHHDIADHLTFYAFAAAVLVPAWALLAWWVPAARLPLSPGRLAAAALAIALAAAIRFLFSYAISLVAFWTTQAIQIFYLMDAGLFLLGGRVAPLDLLPPWAAALGRALPFHAMVGFPVQVLTGAATGPVLVRGLAAQALWLAVAYALFRWVWARGRRAYAAFGG